MSCSFSRPALRRNRSSGRNITTKSRTHFARFRGCFCSSFAIQKAAGQKRTVKQGVYWKKLDSSIFYNINISSFQFRCCIGYSDRLCEFWTPMFARTWKETSGSFVAFVHWPNEKKILVTFQFFTRWINNVGRVCGSVLSSLACGMERKLDLFGFLHVCIQGSLL